MSGSSSTEADLGAVTFHRFNTIRAVVLWWGLQHNCCKKNEYQHKEIGQIRASYIKLSFCYIRHCWSISLGIMSDFKQELCRSTGNITKRTTMIRDHCKSQRDKKSCKCLGKMLVSQNKRLPSSHRRRAVAKREGIICSPKWRVKICLQNEDKK